MDDIISKSAERHLLEVPLCGFCFSFLCKDSWKDFKMWESQSYRSFILFLHPLNIRFFFFLFLKSCSSGLTEEAWPGVWAEISEEDGVGVPSWRPEVLIQHKTLCDDHHMRNWYRFLPNSHRFRCGQKKHPLVDHCFAL